MPKNKDNKSPSEDEKSGKAVSSETSTGEAKSLPGQSQPKRNPCPEESKPMKRRRLQSARDVSAVEADSSSDATEVLEEDSEPFAESTDKLPQEVLNSLLKRPGKLLIAGLVSWDLVGKRENSDGNHTHPNLYNFHRFTDGHYRFAASHCTAGHSVLIGENGEAYTFGRNTFGQLGLGDTETRNLPTLVPELIGKNVIHAAVGRHHTVFVTDTGTVYACGDNRSGQCGTGSVSNNPVTQATRVKYSGIPIVKVGCGAEFSMILDCSGVLHSFGRPEYGQLGHNTDGKYFVTSNKLSFSFETKPRKIVMFVERDRNGHPTPVTNVEIVDFACGTNHTVAIDATKRVFSWGFGGFGRLGHACPRDEAVPRLIKFFDAQGRGVRAVFSGSTYSLAVNDTGTLYLLGRTKRSGEANMYPKPVQDLTGWNVHSAGTSNTSVVIAADDGLVAWGVSPTYGELGTGDICKSSARPREVSRMDGLAITHVTMGYSHTLLLCDDSTEEVREKLETKPIFDPAE